MDKFRGAYPGEEREDLFYEYDGQRRSMPHPWRLRKTGEQRPELRQAFEAYCNLVEEEDTDSPAARP